MGGLAILAALFKFRGDAHKARADKAEEYNDTRKDLDEADTFTGGDDARDFLRERNRKS